MKTAITLSWTILFCIHLHQQWITGNWTYRPAHLLFGSILQQLYDSTRTPSAFFLTQFTLSAQSSPLMRTAVTFSQTIQFFIHLLQLQISGNWIHQTGKSAIWFIQNFNFFLIILEKKSYFFHFVPSWGFGKIWVSYTHNFRSSTDHSDASCHHCSRDKTTPIYSAQEQ